MESRSGGILHRRSLLRSGLLIGALPLLCLAPFTRKAFHVDDPLFVWTARQIAAHPLDPYGFRVVWDRAAAPMWSVTQNPPLASYYGAVIGKIAGLPETTQHCGFLLAAVAAAIATYLLARRFTRLPLTAAAVAVLTPVFLVSASSVMCDTLMLALWLFAAWLWMEGLEPLRPGLLTASGMLLAACALAKYFGASLIVLLLVYSLARTRRLGAWAWFLLIPIAALCGYQWWSKALYGHGLLTSAAHYARSLRATKHSALPAQTLLGLSFTGGCILPVLFLAPLAWLRCKWLQGLVAGGIAGAAFGLGWISLGKSAAGYDLAGQALRGHRILVSIEFAVFVAGGILVLWAAIADWWKRRDAESLFLTLWVLGTFVFAAFVNWTMNARSLLPLVPAAAVLLARRLEPAPQTGTRRVGLAIALLLSAVVAIWVTAGDVALANSAQTAAALIHKTTTGQPGAVWFEGRWGFQYYMQEYGAHPVEAGSVFQPGDLVVIPGNNTYNDFAIAPEQVGSRETIGLKLPLAITTQNTELGAGFYAAGYGPLPFAIGPVPEERYELVRIALKKP